MVDWTSSCNKDYASQSVVVITQAKIVLAQRNRDCITTPFPPTITMVKTPGKSLQVPKALILAALPRTTEMMMALGIIWAGVHICHGQAHQGVEHRFSIEI